MRSPREPSAADAKAFLADVNATMLRLGVEYDLLPRESEILRLKFWAAAFELLKVHLTKHHLSPPIVQEKKAPGIAKTRSAAPNS